MSDFVIQNKVLKKYIGNKEKVVIPDGVTSIGAYAFRDCFSVSEIVIPDSVTCIEENAFVNCPNIVIKGKKESAAEKYARKRKITFEEI